jgi:hypothetical protein
MNLDAVRVFLENVHERMKTTLTYLHPLNDNNRQ